MHVIKDLEGFLKKIEEAVYVWFGTGIDGENGKDAIKAVIAGHISLVKTKEITEPKKVKKTKKSGD